MKLKITLLIILSSGLLFFNPSFVKAQSDIEPSIAPNNKNLKQNLKLQKATFKEILQTAKDERKTKIEEMKVNFKAKRDDFKAKIALIKDQKKKNLTEKIDNRMATVNKNQTDRMLKALEQLTEHITKLEEKVAKAKINGKDVMAIEKLISTAKTAISDATAIVEEQAGKDYVFVIEDEKNLRTSIKASYDLLSTDLKSTQASLVKAKEAVVAVFKAIGTLEKIVTP